MCSNTMSVKNLWCEVARLMHSLFLSLSSLLIHNHFYICSLGADVIYDPSCLPHLVQVLLILLNKKKSCDNDQEERGQTSLTKVTCADGKVNGASHEQVLNDHDLHSSSSYAYDINTNGIKRSMNDANGLGSRADPVAYIASVIRNIDTFNHFLALAGQADLKITDLTSTLRPLDLLPYMKSYDRSSIRLFTVSSK